LSPKQTEHLKVVKPSSGAGLDQARFQALLQASRSPTSTTKALDLRKEVAWKAHKSKQFERRALFLSKIDALPSPTAASLPVTPPESPAVFHFTLPSPGLVSPLALFEALEKVQGKNGPPPVRVEQVDFRAKARREAESLARLTGNVSMSMKVHGLAGEHDPAHGRDINSSNGKSRKGLPSLDEISKRLAGNVTVSRAEPMGSAVAQGQPAPSVNRLPAFLKRASTEIRNEVVIPTQEDKQQLAPIPPAKDASIGRPRIQGVGRLAFAPVPGVTRVAEVPQPMGAHGPIPQALPRTTSIGTNGSANSNASAFKYPTTDGHAAAFRSRPERPNSLSSLQALTSNSMSGNHVTGQKAPTPLTAEALQQLAKRTQRGNVMVERLSRRVSAPGDMNSKQQQQQQQVHQQRRNMRGGF
jgi:hypothetical protein